jgi:DUF4097 and DUF4098 domain-containing protein YvlB
MLFATTLAAAVVLAGTNPDTTLTVAKGTRLSVNNHAGRITVTGWNRNDVQIRWTSEDEDGDIRVEYSGGEVRVAQRMRHGPSEIDLTINAPAWMTVSLQGVETSMTISGITAPIKAHSVEGEVVVSGGADNVNLSSVDGDVRANGVRGNLDIQAVDGNVTVQDLVGALNVQGVDGDVRLEGITSSSIRINTVDGDIRFSGAIAANGNYGFKTHDGDISIRPVGALNATVSVSTWDGEFESAMPVTISGSQEGKRFSFTVGTGSARLDLEAFDGLIRLEK